MSATAEFVAAACLLEATARKAGNVHPGAEFPDLRFIDFALSAGAIAPVIARVGELGVGPCVLEAIRATRRVTNTNTNLGIVLLLAPLAAAPPPLDPSSFILPPCSVADTRAVYEAIRLAAPGGLGRADRQDVADEPTESLHAVMALAADRDSIARQYVNGFADVFDLGVPELARRWNAGWEDAVIDCHLRFMAELPDSLIARKHGLEAARQAAAAARRVLDLRIAGGDSSSCGTASPSCGTAALGCDAALAAFDAELRAKRWNPGTSADLTAASLFAALATGTIALPPPARAQRRSPP